MSRIITFAFAGAAIFCANTLLADTQGMAVRDLPDHGSVTVSGGIKKVESSRKFILDDNSGTIEVTIPENESMVLKEGDKITVAGTVIGSSLWGLLEKHINASTVEVHKDLGDTLSDAVRKDTNISLDQAKPVQIANLPQQGFVKISGSVTDVMGAKDFTLEDASGIINVYVQSGENAVLVKGTQVTLTGYVENDPLGKNIRATHIMVTTNNTEPHIQN